MLYGTYYIQIEFWSKLFKYGKGVWEGGEGAGMSTLSWYLPLYATTAYGPGRKIFKMHCHALI